MKQSLLSLLHAHNLHAAEGAPKEFIPLEIPADIDPEFFRERLKQALPELALMTERKIRQEIAATEHEEEQSRREEFYSWYCAQHISDLYIFHMSAGRSPEEAMVKAKEDAHRLFMAYNSSKVPDSAIRAYSYHPEKEMCEDRRANAGQ